MDLKAALDDPFHFPVDGTPPLYVSQLLTEEFATSLTSFIGTLNGFQVRSFQRTPLKAKRTRRLVYGMREVCRDLDLGKLTMILVASDLDEGFIESENWALILGMCHDQSVPVVFGLTKRQMSMAVTGNPRVRIGIIGVKSFDGSHEAAMEILAESKRLSTEWHEHMAEFNVGNCALAAAFYGHQRLLKLAISNLPEVIEAFVPSTGDEVAHLAAARGHIQILTEIKAISPALLNSKNFAQQTALDLAVMYNRDRVAKFLSE